MWKGAAWKKKPDCRIVWRGGEGGGAGVESERSRVIWILKSIELTLDVVHNASPFAFFKFIRRTFPDNCEKENSWVYEKVIAISRPMRRWSILNLSVPITVEEIQ